MRRVYLVCLFLFLTVTFLLPQSNPVPIINRSASVASLSDPKTSGNAKAQARILDAQILDNYGKLPLSFEANHGQADARVKFLSRTNGYTLFLTADEAVLAFGGKKQSSPQGLKPASLVGLSGTAEAVPFPFVHAQKIVDGDGAKADRSDRSLGDVLRMKLRNANAAAKISGVDELAGKSNYFIGNDPAKWRTGVPTYAKVKYEGIYSGIDLVYYGNQRQLEYDFIVAPGADARQIGFEVRGAKRILRDAQGELVFKVGEGEVRWHKPVVYQEKDGARELVAARYVVTDRNRVGFEIAKYDAGRTLYIDPLIYSTYLGGSGYDVAFGITVDVAGSAYVAGWTCSADFPTVNPLQPIYAGGSGNDCGDTFVSKINPSGSALVFSTYLGGSLEDVASGIAVDNSGNAYVTGYTESADFPVTPGAFQTTYGGGGYDAFVFKINSTGSALVYSTYLGGSSYDLGYGIAVDSDSSAYLAGNTNSTDFPTTPGAFQTTGPGGFVAKINPSGSALLYSTYLDGSGPVGVAVDSADNAYITGGAGADFPTTSGALQTTFGGEGDAFVTKINPTGSALVYSTYLGGSESDEGLGITADSAGNVYVTGVTGSTNFPVTPGAFQTACKNAKNCRNDTDIFVTKLNPAGSALVFSSYLGGNGYDEALGITTDSAGNVYVTGFTGSANFPVTPGAFQTVCKKSGSKCPKFYAFVSKMNPAGSALVYSTYLGGSGYGEGYGIALDNAGNAYVAGSTASSDFPLTPGALQTTYGGGGDAFVTKIEMLAATTTTLSSSPNPSTSGQAVTFTAMVTSIVGAPPDGEAVSFMKGKTVLGTGTLSGGSASFVTSTLEVGTASVKAVYGGDSNFAGSTSKVVKQVVEKAGE